LVNEAAVRRLIVTADDFGLAIPVNEAVEQAHVRGILSTASLMVAAPQTADAVARARGLPNLRVGLHVVLVNGRPALPPSRVPDLVDADGRFSSNLFAAGVRYFFKPGIRAQLEAEIREQFRLFAQTGLALDHANAQNHMHVHPTILSLIMKIGRDFGLRAIRIPYEPFGPAWRATRTRFRARFMQSASLAPWMSLMKRRVRAAGFAANDYVFGMIDTGHMTATLVENYIAALPPGVSEIYSHPATARFDSADPSDADYAGEFAALIDPCVIERLRGSDVRPVTFSELAYRGA
jgi:hopanoid biosynthesis associated protein HpnK